MPDKGKYNIYRDYLKLSRVFYYSIENYYLFYIFHSNSLYYFTENYYLIIEHYRISIQVLSDNLSAPISEMCKIAPINRNGIIRASISADFCMQLPNIERARATAQSKRRKWPCFISHSGRNFRVEWSRGF